MDAALLIVDLSDPACLEQVETVRTILRERRVTLTNRWEPAGESPGVAAEGAEDPFALQLPTLLVANKVECLADGDAELRAFLEITGLRYPALTVSAATVQGLGKIGPWLFSHLGLARVPLETGGGRWELVRSAETSTTWRSNWWPPGRGTWLTVSSALPVRR